MVVSWLKKVGRNLIFEGVNLTKVSIERMTIPDIPVEATIFTELFYSIQISLPVELFEAKSFLERVCDSWCYLELLIKAAEAKDPVERMRYIIAFAVSGLSLQVSPRKPFNPILGETFQV